MFALLASVIAILLLIRRFHVGFAVFVGALLLGFLTLGLDCLRVLYETVTSLQTLKYLVIFVLAFTLAYSMKESGVLHELTTSALSVFGRFSVVVIPAMIGLLPMPGGAIVSAVMLKDVFDKFKIDPERATFLNYWFRHVWASIDPIYPSVILTLAILELSYPTMLKSTYPVTIAMIISGLPFLAKTENFRCEEKTFRGLLYVTPILAVMALTVLGVDLLYSLVLSILAFYSFRRPNFKAVFKRVFDLRILLLVISLLFYKNVVLESNSAERLMNSIATLGMSGAVIASIVSFTMGFATGIESGYAAIAIPILSNFTGLGGNVVPKNLMLVVGLGIVGVMLSPLHLCLILTKEYYSADLERVYKRYLIPSSLVTLALVFAVYQTL